MGRPTSPLIHGNFGNKGKGNAKPTVNAETSNIENGANNKKAWDERKFFRKFHIPLTLTVDSSWTLPLLVLAVHLYFKAYLLSMSVITRSFPTLSALPMLTGLF